jgi:ABC-type branched-subunit amino acid transport system substrate-binding protein
MFDRLTDRRRLVSLAALALLGACTVVPKGPKAAPPPPPKAHPSQLPQDISRHRVALLVPLTGPNAAVGQSIANAATMALLDTNAKNMRVTNYDTGAGAAGAAERALADGNQLILGPLMADDIPPVASAARAAHVPVISFSNDRNAAGHDVFIMGTVPAQSIARTVNYASAHGVHNFAALVPNGDYGERTSTALLDAAKAAGGTVIKMEPFDRANTSVVSAAHRLASNGGFDAVMILDSGRIARLAAPALHAASPPPRILGTELWTGDRTLFTNPALHGALFSALSDARFGQFSTSYKTRFGTAPYRIATVGYDAVLLTLRISREWPDKAGFPMQQLLDPKGFLGLDGPFRFARNGVVERAFEVREVGTGGVSVVSPAPTHFVE